MAQLFLDTSAFIKLYRPEIGSNWLKNFITGNDVVISQLVLYESMNSFARLQREGVITKRTALILYQRIKRDSRNFKVMPLGDRTEFKRVVSVSLNLPSSLRLRTLDSIHLASASIAQEAALALTPPSSFTFVSADAQLLLVAQHYGFVVENPETHP